MALEELDEEIDTKGKSAKLVARRKRQRAQHAKKAQSRRRPGGEAVAVKAALVQTKLKLKELEARIRGEDPGSPTNAALGTIAEDEEEKREEGDEDPHAHAEQPALVAERDHLQDRVKEFETQLNRLLGNRMLQAGSLGEVAAHERALKTAVEAVEEHGKKAHHGEEGGPSEFDLARSERLAREVDGRRHDLIGTLKTTQTIAKDLLERVSRRTVELSAADHDAGAPSGLRHHRAVLANANAVRCSTSRWQKAWRDARGPDGRRHGYRRRFEGKDTSGEQEGGSATRSITSTRKASSCT